MKIGKIILKGFQQFENFCLDLVNPETGKPPEKICFIGPNGTGKSTLLELIIRFLNKVNEPAGHPNQLANQPFFAVKIHTSAGDFLACSTFYGHPPFGNSIAYYNPDIEHTDEWHRFVADPEQYTMPVGFCLQYYIAGQPVPPLASDRDLVIHLPADQPLLLQQDPPRTSLDNALDLFQYFPVHHPKDAKRIRDELLKEQIGFCAYSERYVQNTDAVDVEHFDARLKGTENDSYWNWYAVLSWMNKRKPRKIEPFEPILKPYSEDIDRRIKYEEGQFLAIDPNDKEANNLIEYLGWNSPELYEDRRKHIDRIRFVQKACGDDQESFFDYLVNHPDNLSFFSALSVELGLPETLIERVNKR